MADERAILWGVGGVIVGFGAGAWWHTSRVENARKSRCERENGQFTAEIVARVGEVLSAVVFQGQFRNEDHYRDRLARHLERRCGIVVEVAPDTPFGRPDILLGGVLALEVKRALNKAEQDRCVGQCANYSREWATAIVIFDTAVSRVQQLQDVLKDKGLDHIPVLHFVQKLGE